MSQSQMSLKFSNKNGLVNILLFFDRSLETLLSPNFERNYF